VAASAIALGLATTEAVAADVEPSSTTRVTVIAGKPSEFEYELSRKAVKRGRVIFKVVNRGAIPHDFAIAGKKTRVLAPGESTRLGISIARAGRYAYVCMIAGHAAAGMKGSLRVR
jgi:uncharacterized cupredoxin-like copper-binding protein